MANQLGTVENFIVLMLENRSFDNLLGFLYTDEDNKSRNGDPFDGLTGDETNPTYADGSQPIRVDRKSVV